MRSQRLMLLVAVLLFPLMQAIPAFGAGTGTPPATSTTPKTTDPRSFVPGGFALSGEISGPGFTKPRPITAVLAGKFMASWLAYSVIGHPPIQNPPPAAVKYTVRVKQVWEGAVGTLIVSYAKLGNEAWVTMPAPQNLGWAMVVTPKWIKAQDLTIVAFHNAVGELPAPPATPAANPAEKSSSGTSAWIWIVVVGAVVLLIVGLGFFLRRRRTQTPEPPVPSERVHA